MRIFVAAWYYPPVTSSEGIVTYKLLRCSSHEYDVFSSTSKQWSYHKEFNTRDEKNIHVYSIQTDDIMTWVDACIEKFEELYPARQYDCIMTRSTPPESILVGLRIKEKHPEIKWIASLADPVANNPYELVAYIDNNPFLKEREKKQFRADLMGSDLSALTKWESRAENGSKLLCKLRRWESETVQKADLIISPTDRQLEYINGQGGMKAKYFPVPHSFCSDFYEAEEKSKTDRIVFSYTGYSDEYRSLEPIVNAVHALKQSDSPALDKLLFRFVGNIPRKLQDKILNYELQDYIHVEAPVDYFESLRVMQESDWLLHVDAFFPELEPGGSLFFAGKLADYLGTGHPILALTGEGSPADRIVNEAGGICLLQWEQNQLASTLEKIAFASEKTTMNKAYIDTFNAVNVAKRFDSRVNVLTGRSFTTRTVWPKALPASETKLLSVCVPSYNVQRCLDRCLYTLVSCSMSPYMDIIVVDDGSKDHTPDIANAYAAQYPDIVRVIRKPNGGHGSTINTAMAAAIGKYFRVVDGDDWIDSAALDAVLKRIHSGEIDSDIVSSPYHIVNLETGDSYPFEQDCPVEENKPVPFAELDLENVYLTMASCMTKLSILRQMNMQLQEHTFFVDVEYILFPIPYVQTVTFTPEHIYKYSQGSEEQSIHIPNMVRRYDHHERVMKRVIQYRMDTPMDDAHATYYDSILKRLLYSHYSLCTVYAEDKTESYQKLKPFDQFLKETHPAMAEWIGNRTPVVKVARRCDYQYKRIQHSFSSRMHSLKLRLKNWALAHKAFAKKLVFNKLTYKIATSRFFSEGKGRVLRDKIYNRLSR